MTTVTLRYQGTGTVPGDGRPVTMRGPSLTIGRGQGCDMVLPDPDRMVSSNHAVIENHNGNVVVIDLSTNGTFLNYGKIALGRTPTPLNSGDVLSIGPYELVVEIVTAAPGIAAPLGEEGIGYGEAAHAPDPLALLDQAAPGGDFLDNLLGAAPPAGPGQFKAEPDDPFDQLLAPLGDEKDPFFGEKDPLWEGAAQADNSAAGRDAFRPALAQRAVIPDDWDDLLRPDPAPAAAPSPAARAPAPPTPASATPAPAAPAPATAQPPAGPPPAAPVAAPATAEDPFADLLGDAPLSVPLPEGAPASADPFGEPGDAPVAPPAPAPVAPAAPPRAAAPPAAAPAAAPTEQPAATPSPSADSEAAARAFLRALGAEGAVSDADLPAAMERLGGVLRAMITGIREVLMTRTHFKGEFRIDQTMIAATGNNPLKFSVSPEQAIEAFARTGARGYLPAEQATAQALGDIRAHEVAMITGMEAALKGLLKRLDPAVLEEKLAAKGGAGFFSNRKAKYWELYEEMYAEIADQAENQFQDLFAREFASAYKAQLERLK